MTWLRLAPWAIILVLIGWVGWLKYDAAKVQGRIDKAVLEAERTAKDASDKAILKIASELNKAQNTKETYVEKIVAAPATPADDACRQSKRMQLGNIGVRAIVLGSPTEAERSTANAVREAISGAQPR